MAELDRATYELVLKLSARGDGLVDADDYGAALESYNKAWRLLPEPKSQWNAATWLLAAVGDTAYLGGFLEAAREALDYVMSCPDAIGNPFLHLRRGQVLLDQGEHDAAADELMRAYMGGGSEIFADEPERYLDFLRTRAVLP